MKNKKIIKKKFTMAAQNHQKNNFVEARNLYEEVISLDSNHYEAIFYLGTLYGQHNNFEIALKWLDKAKKIRPDDVNVHINIGNALKELKKYDQSIRSYERAIDIDPSILFAHNNLGIVLKEQLKYTQAIKCFEKVVELNPNYLTAYNSLGTIFGELKILNKWSCNDKKINSTSLLLNTNKNFPIFVKINSNDPENASIKVRFIDHTLWSLCPIEKLNIYNGNKIIKSRNNFFNKEYKSILKQSYKETKKLKPGFLKQMKNFSNLNFKELVGPQQNLKFIKLLKEII